MILTGKAKEDFLKFHNQTEVWLYLMIKSGYYPTIYSLIIEWLDSVGIYVNVGGVIMDGISNFSFDIQENNTLNGMGSCGFDSRQEATKQAIIKANEIYNNL